MTFNILEGGNVPLGDLRDRREIVSRVVTDQSPDIIALQECVNWESDGNRLFREFQHNVGMSGLMLVTDGFPISVLVKDPFTIVSADSSTDGFWHGVIDVLVDDGRGSRVRVLCTHLHPRDTDLKLSEIKTVLRHYRKGEPTVIMGDFNAISHLDDIRVSELAEPTRIRHSRDGELDFRVTQELEGAGFTDTFACMHPHRRQHTIPTPATPESEFSPVRLDYIFVSDELAEFVVSSDVVDDKYTQVASDHYPLVTHLNHSFSIEK